MHDDDDALIQFVVSEHGYYLCIRRHDEWLVSAGRQAGILIWPLWLIWQYWYLYIVLSHHVRGLGCQRQDAGVFILSRPTTV